ncbi:MAG: IS110 family transposase [Pedobacter sp.]|nr:MAG: IS110 family transposase [Pedobacter sp.]
MKKIFMGIDISSRTLDICLKTDGKVRYFNIQNDPKAIRPFLKKHTKAGTIVAMENTGRYNWHLFEVLQGLELSVYVLAPIHLKKSLGLARGKNDKVDSLRICSFIEKNEQDCKPWKQSPLSVRRLKVLLTERESRVKMKGQLARQQHDYKLMKTMGMDKELLKLNKKLIEAIDIQIKKIECDIEKHIGDDIELREKARLIRSVPGVGKVVSWMMIAKTDGFTSMSDPRKMACYCGVVPFEHQSGTSLRYRPRVSVFADKKMKSLLHLAAMSAIRLNNQLRIYYLRKVQEGKNKMSVLNAVRNKIIHRIFAVIKNQTIYKNDLVLS